MTKNICVYVLLLLPILNFGQEFELNFTGKNISKEVLKIVEKIGIKNEIHAEYVGFGMTITDQYKGFEALLKIASTGELIALMQHPKSAVRGYTFWALAKRYYANLEDVLMNHINDEEIVFQLEGCLGENLAVIDFMRWVVTPSMIDMDCKKSTLRRLARLRKN